MTENGKQTTNSLDGFDDLDEDFAAMVEEEKAERKKKIDALIEKLGQGHTSAHEKKVAFSKYMTTQGFPSWAGIEDLDHTDAERIFRYYPDYVVREKGTRRAYLRNARGFLIPFASSDSKEIEAECFVLVRKAREKAAAELLGGEVLPDASPDGVAMVADYLENMPRDARKIASLTRSLSFLAGEKGVELDAAVFDRIDRHAHIVPLDAGGALDIRTDERLNADRVAALRLVDRGWLLPDEPRPDPNASGSIAMTKAIKKHYTRELLRRIARHLLGLSKNIDIIVAPGDWGKSTFITILSRAFPGLVSSAEAAVALSAQGTRYGVVKYRLTQCRILFIDEAGHLDAGQSVAAGTVNVWISDELDVERKFENARLMRRSGTVILIGHTWPGVDASSQGVMKRVRWAFRASDDAPVMTDRERELLLSDDAIGTMRYAVLAECRALHKAVDEGENIDDATSTPESREAVAHFQVARMDPYAAALRDKYEPAGSGDFVPSSGIAAALMAVDESGKRPHGKIVEQKMRLAFHAPHVRPGRKYVAGQKTQQRVWFGIREKRTSH